LAGSLSGCAGPGANTEDRNRLAVTCTQGAQCDLYWKRALAWVTQNSTYPVKASTGWAILTDIANDYRSGLSYRITRWPRDDGGQDIVFVASCSVFLPCSPLPAVAFARFREFLTTP
jgi:hypothetical protein